MSKGYKIKLPDKKFLKKTGEVDYFDWNYKFPINIIQKYRFNAILKLLNHKRVESLLEIGTGSGIFLPSLSEHCEYLYSCDIHKEQESIIGLCKAYDICNFKYDQVSIESTNYPDNHFDIIIGVSVLEFVDDLEKAIFEIKRILKPDGFFLTICPMNNNLLNALLSIYTARKSEDEVVNTRGSINPILEHRFNVIEKGYMLPIIGKQFPIYTHYKLMK